MEELETLEEDRRKAEIEEKIDPGRWEYVKKPTTGQRRERRIGEG